ncbi:MAG TPA: DUF58 domain-containing protein [Gemmatimonadaceae bacterium]|nr:DUF58 domain-containing protein [Gemmatimonadaceae bacterium]
MSALSPTVVAAIDDLELAARIVVEGLRTGGHRSPFHGYSTEFRQHRPYRAGDDLKYLDWKLFARSDRLYTRQFRETTNLSVMIVLDTSASMAYPPHGVSKFQYGQIVAAALSYLVSEQGHAVGLMTMDAGKLSYVAARGGRQHLRALLARIDRFKPAGAWDPARVIARSAQLLQRRGVVIVISDFYDAEEDTRREMRRVAQRGHDVAMLQLISPSEMDLPYAEHVELEDLESGVRRLVDATTIAPAYHDAMHDFLARCRSHALRDGVDYALMSTATPPETALRDYLLRRSRGLVAGHAPRAVQK